MAKAPLATVNATNCDPDANDAHGVEAQFNKLLAAAPDLDLVFCILRDKTPKFYQTIKYVTDGLKGLACGCFVQDWVTGKARGGGPQLWANLALKVNAKLGGVNFTCQNKTGGTLITAKKKNIMVLGGDVTHPQGDLGDENSLSSVVASMDMDGGRFISRVELNTARVDIIENLGSMFGDLLLEHYQRNGNRKPDAILYYRDGVSEGQYNEVMAKEYAALKLTIQEFQEKYGDWEPTVTVVIVQKRHHLRMFQENRAEQDRSTNALPGTIIDSGVCSPTNFDFYLQSHAGIQGTSRPTLYNVLVDEYGFGPDEIQTITFELCHVYQRCTRSVSIPTPVYYAHLAAFRARALYNRYTVLDGKVSRNSSTGFNTSKKLKPGDSLKPSGSSMEEQADGENIFSGIHEVCGSSFASALRATYSPCAHVKPPRDGNCTLSHTTEVASCWL